MRNHRPLHGYTPLRVWTLVDRAGDAQRGSPQLAAMDTDEQHVDPHAAAVFCLCPEADPSLGSALPNG